MARVYEIDGVVPVIDPEAFVHPDAVLIGDVLIGPGCYIGPLASLRGDFGRIEVHAGANIQDGCVVHCFPGSVTVVGENGHVGHGSVLHGCRVGRDVLVGMNSVLMDGVVVEDEAFVGAMSFVKAETRVPARSLIAGSPAKVLRELTPGEIDWKANGTRTYQDLARRSLASLRETVPAAREEPGRRGFTGSDGTEPVHVTLHSYRAR
ncbi:transferase hexapeptide repeat family protein [Amycolatopsis sp. NPDC051128]|uniref:acyltransferase n=1 Tax=Amycolatopsis sp. NPDC051128 TaxID=3155412 RepID=UPI003415EAE6